MSFSVIIPTYNGNKLWRCSASSIAKQTAKPDEVLCVDSTSTDDTMNVSGFFGFKCVQVDKQRFNHGGTRNYAARLLGPKSDFVIFLTQDAILDNEFSFSEIIKCFSDPNVAAVCGRQLPHYDANPLARHARLFNYPAVSQEKSSEDIEKLGLKVAFMSNSFSAYRRDIFEKLGGFPENTILAEDMYLASKMILAGYKVVYCAEAVVRHSHNYTPWEELRRYFDTGVFHACEPWIQKQLGGASGEGLKFVRSEINYLFKNAPFWIPRALVTICCKLIGYNLGKRYKQIPSLLRPRLSMYKSYWLQNDNNM